MIVDLYTADGSATVQSANLRRIVGHGFRLLNNTGLLGVQQGPHRDAATRNYFSMIPVSEPLLRGNELNYVRDCIATGWISSGGEYVARFERCWADYCGMKHGIAVSSGTAALQVAVDALRLEPGDEVIMPAFTIISCALAVIRAAASPVLVDSDPRTYCMDVNQVAAAITSRTRALMPVHIYGHPVDMDPLIELAKKHNLAIIEDAAEAHGCEYFSQRGGSTAWRRCGGFGTLSTFSFYGNKLVTSGEGGMVLTNDDALAERCRSLRNLCFQQRRFYHEELGYSFRLSNVQAAIGLAQAERLEEILDRKRQIGALYDALLADVSGIKLPPRSDWAAINYWMYGLVLLTDHLEATSFAALLKAEGVETRPFFMGLHQQPALQRRGLFRNLHFPVAERLHRCGIYLPSGVGLTDRQVGQVAQAVKKVLAPLSAVIELSR
jgi:perosamine synthetase